MNLRQTMIAAILCTIILAGSAWPQTPKPSTPRRPNSAPAAQPRPTPEARTIVPAKQTTTSAALALVGNQSVTLNDLDPKALETISGLDKEIADARRNALDSLINHYLLEAEAKKRKLTVEQLTDAEVADRVVGPTEEEIKAVYEANHEQIGSADIATVRPQIVAYLRSQRSSQLYTDFITRLRAATPPLMSTAADVNAPNLTPTTVLATVNGRPINAAVILERAKPWIYEARMKAYETEQTALDQKINDLLLEAEAKRRNITPDALLKTEITDKLHQPTDAEVAKFYEDNKERIGNADLASVRSQIADYLRDHEQIKLQSAFAEKLRAGATVRVMLTEPEPPTLAVSTDDDPSRGDLHAPVTVVVFTDFQCPACKAMHPLIDEVIKSYGNRVRLVVRDYPLPQHEFARKAAEAANAANAQGKFFEYMAALFNHQPALDVPSLKKYASEIGLDRAKFDAALDSGMYAAEVSHDIADGDQYGINSTPSIFVNGIHVRLLTLTAEPIRIAIDNALKNKK